MFSTYFKKLMNIIEKAITLLYNLPKLNPPNNINLTWV